MNPKLEFELLVQSLQDSKVRLEYLKDYRFQDELHRQRQIDMLRANNQFSPELEADLEDIRRDREQRMQQFRESIEQLREQIRTSEYGRRINIYVDI
jgi:polyhydroxyalkanoate synthesis regulator phasin